MGGRDSLFCSVSVVMTAGGLEAWLPLLLVLSVRLSWPDAESSKRLKELEDLEAKELERKQKQR